MAHIGAGIRSVRVHIWSMMVFGYHFVGIANMKCSRWGSRTMQGPNTNGFAFGWNIGFRISCMFQNLDIYHYIIINCDLLFFVGSSSKALV